MDYPAVNFLSAAAKKKKGKNKVEEGRQWWRQQIETSWATQGRDPKSTSFRNVAAVGQKCQERIRVPSSLLMAFPKWVLLSKSHMEGLDWKPCPDTIPSHEQL